MIKKILFIFLGSLALAIGCIGIVTPGIPVTPLVLLSAYLYSKSSTRLHNALLNNKILGGYIKHYSEKGGMTKKAKLYAISLMWLMIGISTIFFVENRIIEIAIISLGVIGMIVMGFVVKSVE
ncbi:MAG: YbaN family protein [Rikenellaceae bacterium]